MSTNSPSVSRLAGMRGRRRPATPLITKVDNEEQGPPLGHFEKDFIINGECVEVKTDDLEKLRKLGHGAYGSVHLMRHKPTGTYMAVKLVPYKGSADERRRLLMDVDVNRKTGDFPYTVKFFGALFEGGDVWLCMEVMDTSLDKFYKMVYENGKTIPEEVLGKIAVAVISALEFLKSKLNIMHRDVKPSNILVNRNGEVKMCDYGISGKLVDSLANSVVGCRPYMGPERISAESSTKPYGTRSDIWSFGITMMELATGQFPYSNWTTVFQQIKQVVECDPPRLPTDGNFSEDLQDLIAACLQKDYEMRPKYDDLVQHPFLLKYKEKQVDVGGYVSSILDKYSSTTAAT